MTSFEASTPLVRSFELFTKYTASQKCTTLKVFLHQAKDIVKFPF